MVVQGLRLPLIMVPVVVVALLPWGQMEQARRAATVAQEQPRLFPVDQLPTLAEAAAGFIRVVLPVQVV